MSRFSATVLTLFPEMFPGPLGHSLAGRALEKGLWELETMNIRDFAADRHKTVDDTPYGGGAGMVMRPDVVDAAIREARKRRPEGRPVYMTPRGIPLTQALARELAGSDLIILCGRYEGVDERVIEEHRPLEISVGDYVLSGGEIAAMTLLDACLRLIPGIMGDEESLAQESFGSHADYALLLEYPHYTKPPSWKGRGVPEILTSGHHARVEAWRLEQAEAATKTRRPDVWERYIKASSCGKPKALAQDDGLNAKDSALPLREPRNDG